MRIFHGAAGAPGRRRASKRSRSQESWTARLVEHRSQLTPVMVALVVCIIGTVIGLRGPQWLGDGKATVPKPPRLAAEGPAVPPAKICGSSSVLTGPAVRPRGAVRVPTGDDTSVDFGRPHTTFWFVPGVHTLSNGEYYQIFPGNGDRFIGAPGAILDGRHINFYAFGGNARHVTISYLTVRNFGRWGGNEDQGVVNHNSAAWWTITHSTLTGNAGAATMLGSHDVLSYDCLKGNQQYGFNAYSPSGPAHLVVEHDEIADNDTYNWEKRDPDCGCTGGAKFWNVNGAVIKYNWVHDNMSAGLWADTDNRAFDIEDNYISGNSDAGLIYEISYNALIKDNTFIENGLGAGPKNPGFPTGAIYISESGADRRVPGGFSKTFLITGNTFTNNWSGVILWENSNRFCNSPANTSTGFCTLVNKKVIRLASCKQQNLTRQPYFSECRWKTQNVLVKGNVFNFVPKVLGPSCTADSGCGFVGLFSEYGTFPVWSPYKGVIVEKHITFDQNNHFKSNFYNGPWRFMIYQQGNVVNWDTWQESPYSQDAGSILTP
jgi:parallel beta-helix repeat protein